MDDNIDIIIMDLEMPKVNGSDASTLIKNLIETKNFVKCKIIGYTANSEDPGRLWKDEWKMDGFIRKSATEKKFLDYLEKVIEEEADEAESLKFKF